MATQKTLKHNMCRLVSPETMARIAEEFKARRATQNGVAGWPRVPRAGSNRTFRFGDGFELDLGAYELRSSGEPLKLSRIPMDVLHLLIERQGQLVSRDQIVERIWGQEEVSVDADRNINETVRRIRRVLNEDAEQPRFVQTVYKKGYRFIAPVTRESERPVRQSRDGRTAQVLTQSLDKCSSSP